MPIFAVEVTETTVHLLKVEADSAEKVKEKLAEALDNADFSNFEKLHQDGWKNVSIYPYVS